jgi:hypothetical protein
MAVGHSDDVDAADAIATVIDQCRDQLDGLAPQAGFLVAAFDSFGPSLVAAVRDAFPGCALMGSTSSAEISSTGGFLEDSISLALFASDDVDFTAGLGLGLDSDVDGACRAAIAEARSTSGLDPKVCVVFTDPGIVEPQRTLDALAATQRCEPQRTLDALAATQRCEPSRGVVGTRPYPGLGIDRCRDVRSVRRRAPGPGRPQGKGSTETFFLVGRMSSG